MPPAVRTLFFGSGPVALPALQHCLEWPRLEIDSVISAPPRPAGRKGALKPTPVAGAASAAGLQVRSPADLRASAVHEELRATGAELIILADYGRIVPEAVLDIPRHGALNIHPSLLPRHRGASPVAAAILQGDATTGVSVMRMDRGLDTGPILGQRAVSLDGTETAPSLESQLAELGADLLMELLPGWLDGTLQARPQPDDGATLTRQLRRTDGPLDPRRDAASLERQVRAYQPWPGSYLEWDGHRLTVWAASVVRAAPAVPPGTIVAEEGVMTLCTTDGGLRLDEIQPAGRRRMTAAEYLRGKRGQRPATP